MKNKTEQFDVISPDGFSINMEGTYDSFMKAKDGLLQFIHRFKKQGYYSTSNRTRIPLGELYDACEIVPLNN